MDRIVQQFVNRLEGYKTAVKNMHWASRNLSQHKLMDDIAGSLADFQDKIAEVEQAISGRAKLNTLKPQPYNTDDPKKLLGDILKDTRAFYKHIQNYGEDYIGMRSDCEAYISDLQRQQYLLDFTVNESIRRIVEQTVREAINEQRERLSDGEYGDMDVWAELDDDGTIWVEWNYKDGPRSSTRSVWFSKVRGNIYRPGTGPWDELDNALKTLGVRKVGEKSYISDWGEGDTDKFTTEFYDFTPIL